MRQEWKAVLVWYALLTLPGVLEVSFSLSSATYLLPLTLFERALEMIALYIWGYRCLRSLKTGPWRWSPWALTLMVIIGLLLWGACTVPLAAIKVAQSPNLRSLALVLLGLGIVCAYLFYFYFFPLLQHTTSISQVFREARLQIIKQRDLPLRIEIPTMGAMFLLSGLALAFYPDGRHLPSALLAKLIEPLAWVLSSFLGIAYGILMLSESEWHAQHLDPYRKERLASLVLRSSPTLTSLMDLRNGIVLLIVSLSLWGGNTLRLFQMPPAGKIELKAISVEAPLVRVTIEIRDQEYAQRGFEPMQFSLSGENGTMLSPPPSQIMLLEHGRSRDVRFDFPRDTFAHTIDLVFEPTQDAKQLKNLRDIYLWYNHARLMQLDFSKATTLAPSDANPSPSPAQ